jgi:hypothetical protein
MINELTTSEVNSKTRPPSDPATLKTSSKIEDTSLLNSQYQNEFQPGYPATPCTLFNMKATSLLKLPYQREFPGHLANQLTLAPRLKSKTPKFTETVYQDNTTLPHSPSHLHWIRMYPWGAIITL